MTRYSYDVNPALDLRFKRYMLDHHGKVYGCQGDILRRALEEYLDRHEKKSTAPPIEEMTGKKERLPPELVAEIIEYYGDGSRRGGHSRAQTASHFNVRQGQIDTIIRKNKKIK